MRKSFKFSAEILEAGKNIPDKELRLRFYEAILELGINDIQPNEEDPMLRALLTVAIPQILKDCWISTVRSAAWSWWSEAKSKAKLGNKNAKKDRKKTKKEKKSDPIEEVIEMIPVPEAEELTQDPPPPQSPTSIVVAKKRASKSQAKRDEQIELIDTVKEKVESLWLVYRAGTNEWISAKNLLTAKQFKQTAEKFWLTPMELTLAVIDASMQDKWRSWKINNCDTIYYNYAKIINQTKANLHRSSQKIISLPWA